MFLCDSAFRLTLLFGKASKQNKMPGLKRLARIADKFQTIPFRKVDKLDFRVLVVNESKPPRSHVLKQNGCIVLERDFFECSVNPA
jgi:hypothetical protein